MSIRRPGWPGEHTHSSPAARCGMILLSDLGPGHIGFRSSQDGRLDPTRLGFPPQCLCLLEMGRRGSPVLVDAHYQSTWGQRLNSRARASPSGKVRRASARLSGRAAVRPFEMPRLNLGPEVPFVSMHSKSYEAGDQQRCAGHNKAHCHSGGSWMMRVSIRRAFARRATQNFKTVQRKMQAVVCRQDGPRSQKLR
jgi:hypothetical protein